MNEHDVGSVKKKGIKVRLHDCWVKPHWWNLYIDWERNTKGAFCSPRTDPCCGTPFGIGSAFYCCLCWFFCFFCTSAQMLAWEKGKSKCGCCCDCFLPALCCLVCGTTGPVVLFFSWLIIGFILLIVLVIIVIVIVFLVYFLGLAIMVVSIWVPVVGQLGFLIEFVAGIVVFILAIVVVVILIFLYASTNVTILSAICFSPWWPLCCLHRHNVRVLQGIGKGGHFFGDFVTTFVICLWPCAWAQTMRYVPVESWDWWTACKTQGCDCCGDCGWALYNNQNDMYKGEVV